MAEEKFVIQGGRPLRGEIEVFGSKNAALKIFIASLLTDEECEIKNVPEIEDIFYEIELLKDLGVDIKQISKGHYKVRAKEIKKIEPRRELVQKIRPSIMLAGPLLARQGRIKLTYPGGCVIGRRPIDIFLDGYSTLGAKIKKTPDGFLLTSSRLQGNTFIFPQISVTATESLMIGATLAQGKTVLKNAACEPEIVSLANFLNRCGAKIKGAGTNTIEIEGVKKIKGGIYQTIPDRIEAGSFAILGAATNSRIKILNSRPEHLEVLWIILKKMGVNFELGKDYILIKPRRKLLKATNIVTHEYPGFPTDLQPPLTVLLTQAEGMSLIRETVFESRLFYSDILNQMGADIIMCDPHRIVVNGPTLLHGSKIVTPDIRAGIALLIAALIARGKSIIGNISQIDRGYEKIEERLQKLGAEIKRIKN